MVNKLISENSPYLRKHATNPIEWFPWCDEALEKAKIDEKIIFLSIGYSTCHWCHIMEKESFQNTQIAIIMNKYFINIKVDREERPDLDKIFMSYNYSLSGKAGWPISLFLTPNLKPVYGGTYFPTAENVNQHQISFEKLIETIASKWKSNKQSIIDSGEAIFKNIQQSQKNSINHHKQLPDSNLINKKCFSKLLQNYDPEFGGFSSAPKFVQPSHLLFLLRFYERNPEADSGKQALKMCLHTLEMVISAGIYDHVGGGISRYATDDRWNIPHFEKFLSDQAQFCNIISKAYKITQNEKFKIALNKTYNYMLTQLKHPLGGYFTAEDADSNDKESQQLIEGAYYTWTKKEISEVLQEHAKLFCAVFNIKDKGNINQKLHFTDKNILTRNGDQNFRSILKDFSLCHITADNLINECLFKLNEVRNKRPKPKLDKKIICSWNSLTISALCQDGYLINEAEEIGLFINKYLYNNKLLLRCVYDENSHLIQRKNPIQGFNTDYSFFIKSLIDLYNATLKSKWIEWAFILQNIQIEKFWDKTNKDGFFMTSDKSLLNGKDDEDSDEPSGNSISCQNLIRLSHILKNNTFLEKANQILQSFSKRLETNPNFYPEMVFALDLYEKPVTQIIISGSLKIMFKENNFKKMVEIAQKHKILNKVIILADGKLSILSKNIPILNDISQSNEGLTYVCHDKTCYAPISNPNDLNDLLKKIYS